MYRRRLRQTGQNSATSFTLSPASRRRPGPDAGPHDASPDRLTPPAPDRVRYAGMRRCPSLSSCPPLQGHEHDSVNHIERGTDPTAAGADHRGPSGRDARIESFIDLPTHLDRSTRPNPDRSQCAILGRTPRTFRRRSIRRWVGTTVSRSRATGCRQE